VDDVEALVWYHVDIVWAGSLRVVSESTRRAAGASRRGKSQFLVFRGSRAIGDGRWLRRAVTQKGQSVGVPSLTAIRQWRILKMSGAN
jgi:hypothetical protein